MDTLARGIILGLILLGCGILVRGFRAQRGDGPRQKKKILEGILLAASLLTFVVTLAFPVVHAVPQTIVAFVERVMPKQPTTLRHPFRYHPTAEKRDTGSSRR